jgi:hypothetical protein
MDEIFDFLGDLLFETAVGLWTERSDTESESTDDENTASSEENG